jgi:hypothetical protein
MKLFTMQFSAASCYFLSLGPNNAYIHLVRKTEGMKFMEDRAIIGRANIKLDCNGIGWKNICCLH